MTAPSVFDIHLLKEAICRDLSSRDIRRCMLVCWEWHTHFSPYLWRDITLRRKHTLKKLSLPETQAALERHAKHVRVVNNIFADIWPMFCIHPIHNLTVLKSPIVRRQNWTSTASNNYNRDLITLLNANPNLQTLELGHFCNAPETLEDLLDAIQNHSSLQRIRIDHPRASLSSPMLGLVLLSCLKLQRIYINIRVHSTLGQLEPIRDTFLRLSRLIDQASPTTTLKEIHFPGKIYPGDHYVFMNVLTLCSGLEQLTLPKMFYLDATQSLNFAIAHMPQFQYLDVRTANIPFVHLIEIVRACAGLRTFIAGNSPRHNHTEWALTAELLHHHNTLEVVDLTGSGVTGITGAMMHAILCACPNLSAFVTMGPLSVERQHGCCSDPVLKVSDMGAQDDSTWVCHGLRVLKLRFESETRWENDEMTASEVAPDDRLKSWPAKARIVPGVLVDQLSRLLLLEDLRLSREIPRNDQSDDQIMVLGHSLAETTLHQSNRGQEALPQNGARTLSMTLNALLPLQRLKRLELRNLKEFLDKDSLRESRKHWKGIEWIQYS